MNLRQTCPTRRGCTRHPTQARLPAIGRVPLHTITPAQIRRQRHPSGEGILDTIGSVTKGLQGLRLASDVLFGPIGSTVSNVLSEVFNKNPEARPISPGEKHIVLPTKHGLTRANFAGPGTQVKKRIKRGDRGVDGPRGIDAAARTHDLAYVNARTPADIRRADNRMIREVEQSTAGKRTKQVVKAALRAKTLGEDLGVFGPNTFTEVLEDDDMKGRGPLPTDPLMRRAHQQLRHRKRKRPVASSSSTRKRARRAPPPPVRGEGFFADMFKSMAKTVAPIVLKQLTQAVVPVVLDRVRRRFARKRRRVG